MYDLLHTLGGQFAVTTTRTLARSALPDAPVSRPPAGRSVRHQLTASTRRGWVHGVLAAVAGALRGRVDAVRAGSVLS